MYKKYRKYIYKVYTFITIIYVISVQDHLKHTILYQEIFNYITSTIGEI